MKIRSAEIAFCFISIYALAYSQENAVDNQGPFIRVAGGYHNFSQSVASLETGPNFYEDPKFSASISGSFAFGVAIGYRAHGRGPVDGSFEIGFYSSRHQVGYQYQPSSSTAFHPVIPADPSSTENNNISLDALSFDLNVFFLTKSPIQPHATAGFEFYLGQINLRALPLKYYTFNPYDNSTQYFTYSFDNTYSGYGFHGGVGLAYYVRRNVVLDGTIRLSDRVFSLENAGVIANTQFRSLNTEFCGSILFVF
jgi:opacity protein-like surface antigen